MTPQVDPPRRAAVAPWVFNVLCLVTGVVALVQGFRVSGAILLAGVVLHLVVLIAKSSRWRPKAGRPAH